MATLDTIKTNNNAITSEALRPVPKTNFPSFRGVVNDVVPVNEAEKNIEITADDRQAQRDRDLKSFEEESRINIADIVTNLTGQEQELAKQEEIFGVDEAIQRKQALSNQVLQLQAEIQQDDVKLIASQRAEEVRDTLLPFARSAQAKLAGDAAILRALKTSEIGVINAQVLAEQGNITLAQNQAQKAVDAKYAPYRDQIAVYNAQLEALSPILDDAEQRIADRQKRKNDLADKEVQRLADEEKAIQELGLTARANQAPDDVVQKVLASGSMVEAINAIGQYASNPIDNAIKGLTAKEKQLSIKKLTDEINRANTPLSVPAAPGSTGGKLQRYLNSSLNKNDLTAGERESLAKAMTVVDQLDNLETQINEINTGFFSGRVTGLLSKFAGDVDAATVQAGLQAIIPNLARGVFGEVGVLTDSDIENYKKTVPNLTSTEDQNDAVLALVLKTVINSVENQLDAASNSNVNVSGWVGDYQEMVTQVHEIEDRIGVSKAKVDTVWQENPDNHEMIMELFNAGATDREVLQILGAE